MKSINTFIYLTIACLCLSNALQAQAPRITSFTPTSGPVGTSVTITGANFNTGDNDVYFGSVKVQGAGVGGTSITVNVPAGATSVTPITIRNNATGLQASSLESATPFYTVTNSPPLASLDYTNSTFNVSGQSESLTVADFDNDGNMDVATANTSSDNVSIRLGDGLGGFSDLPDVAVGNQPYSVVAADFDNDGNLDMAIANLGSNDVSIRLGDGFGGFSDLPDVLAESEPRSLTVGDFNGDGNMDLAIQNNFPGFSISIRLGNGDGTFSGTNNIPIGSSPLAVVTGDFNNDFTLDLAVTNVAADNVSILLGDGLGDFSLSSTFTVGDQPFSTSIGDFDGDGNLDLATANSNTDNVTISLGDGLGGFTVSATVSVGDSPRKVAVGDFNGDGNMDIATNNRNSGDVSIRLGDGAGNFSGTTNISAGSNPNSIEVGDFNNDGKADLITPNIIGSFVTVLLYTPIPTGNLGLWLKADAGVTVTTGVSNWADQSGNNRNATQATTGAQPAFVASEALAGGEAVVRFDGANDQLPFDGSFMVNTDYTVFLVGAMNTNPAFVLGNSAWFVGGTQSTNNGMFGIPYSANNIRLHHWGNDLSGEVSCFTAKKFEIISGSHSGILGKELKLNGSVIASNNNTEDLVSFVGASLGSRENLLFLNGDIAEFIVYTRTLSAVEYLQVETYLQDKYAIPLNTAQPTTQSSISASAIGATTATLDLIAGDGVGRIVVVQEANAISTSPADLDLSTITADATFGSGTAVCSGQYVVYVDNGTSVALTGLTPGTTYHAKVFEYNGSGNTTAYNLTSSPIDNTTFFSTTSTNPFITTWQTTTANESITIPTTGTGYNFTIDWGDTTVETLTDADAPFSHTYATAGTYTVSITGDFPRIFFDNGGDKDKILSIDQWGDIAWTNMSGAFYGCTNLTYNATDTPDLSSVGDMGLMFHSCSAMVGNASIDSWDVSNVGAFSGMFQGASSFNSPLGSWNVSNGSTFSGMFNGASAFNQDISNWDMSSALDLSGMFANASSFNNGEIGNTGANPLTWTTGTGTANVTNMNQMFSGATAFNQSINTWNVSSVTNMGQMFANATSFNQPIGNWERTAPTVSTLVNVTNMGGMFQNATSFNQPIGNWNTGGVTEMASMFQQASSFNQPIGNWDVSNVNNMVFMFLTASAFDQDISNWDVGNVTNMGQMFDSAVNFNNGGVALTWDVSSVTNMFAMFFVASSFNQDISTWDVSSVQNMQSMFQGATSFNQPIGNWERTAPTASTLASVTNMSNMFEGASSFNQNIANWNVSSLNTTFRMFLGASAFNNGGVPLTWTAGTGTSNVASMAQMFENATNFNQDISTWDVSGVIDMFRMFFGATAFDQNLGTWDIGSVTDMSGMLDNSGMSTANYDATLIDWAVQTVQPNVTLGALNLFYCAGETARNTLTGAPNNWTINDDALACLVDVSGNDFGFANENIFKANAQRVYSFELSATGGDITLTDLLTQATGGDYQATDIADFELYYNDASDDFATAVLIGSSSATAGNGENISFTGLSQTIIGDGFPRYFYIAANVNPTAITGRTFSLPFLAAGDFTFDITPNSFGASFGPSGIKTIAENETDFLAYSFPEEAALAIIDAVNHTIDIEVLNGTDLTNLIANFTLSAGASVEIAGVAQVSGVTVNDFTNLVTYTVTAQDGITTQDWVISVTEAQSNATDFLTFSFPEEAAPAIIDAVNHTIDIEVLNGTDLTTLIADFTLSAGATVAIGGTPQTSGVTLNDFANPLTYTVTAEDGITVQDWVISVTEDQSDATDFLTFSFPEEAAPAIIDAVNHTIDIEVLNGTDLTTLIADFTLSAGATVAIGGTPQTSGVTLNDFTNPLTYTVTAQDGITVQDWVISVSEEPLGFAPFITTWQTTTPNETITVPTTGIGYSFTIDWGDTNVETLTDADAPFSHTYATAGTYTVSITGDFPRIYFDNAGDRLKILTIEQWGDIAWASMENAFYGCANLTYNATDAPDLTGASSLNQMFRECVNFNGNATIQDWNVSTITSLRFTFFGALAFNQPLNNWDVSNVNDMFGLFGSHLNTVTATFNNGEPAGQSTNPLLWNTSSVTDMGFMFLNNAHFNQNISSWDVSQVTDMTFMFAVHRTMPDISQFNSPLNTWVVGNVVSMHGMFFEAENFDQPLDNWVTTSLTDISEMFWGASIFNQPIDSWDVSGVSNLDSTFYDATLFNQPLNSWDVSGVNSMIGTFADATDFNGDISNWQVGNVTDMSNLFSGAFAFNQDISTWNVGSVLNMSNMFANAFAFNQDLSAWDVSQVTDMGAMFLAASAFNSGEAAGLSNNPLNSWNTQNVTNMGQMFAFAPSFNQDISGWQVGSVSNMGQMFEEATLFNQDLSAWDVSQVFRMYKMFFNATAFNQNLATWNIGGVAEDPDTGVTDDGMTEMLDGSGLLLANYDATLIGWATLDAGETQIPTGITLGAAGLIYCDAEPERQTLIDAFGWTITGDVIGCSLPPNDACATAQPITIGSTTVGQTLTATIDDEVGLFDCNSESEPSPVDAPGVWYTFVGNGDVLQAATCVAEYDTKISVYSGECTNLVCEAGNDDNEVCGAESLSSSVNICTVAGTTYYILVHGFDTERGNFELTLTTATDVPEITVFGNSTEIINGDITPDVADDTDFGQVQVGQSLTRTFTLQNTGNVDLFISSGFFTNFISFDVFGLAEIPAILAGESITFDVEFTPSDFNVFSDTLIIFSNTCTFSFVVQGEGVGTPPDAPLAPTGLSVFVASGGFEVSWLDELNGSNVLEYRIERRIAGEESDFSTLATVPAGNQTFYFYTDGSVSEGLTYFYRVIAVSGSIVSSPSEEVGGVFGIPTSLSDLNFKVQTNIYPNPSTEDLVVSLESNYVGEIKMKLVDLVGKQVWSSTWNKTSNAESYTIKGKDLAVGTYFLMLESGSQKAVFKLIRH